MRKLPALLILLAFGAAVSALEAAPLRASSGRPTPALPHDLGQLYATLDRGDLLQHREMFAPAAALAAIKDGRPLPSGTVLTMVVYSVKRDEAGQPLRDAQGRFVKGAVSAFLVMRKRRASAQPSFGAAAGHWQFQLFGPDRRPDRTAKMTVCAACHERARDGDFVFTAEDMKAFASEHAAR